MEGSFPFNIFGDNGDKAEEAIPGTSPEGGQDDLIHFIEVLKYGAGDIIKNDDLILKLYRKDAVGLNGVISGPFIKNKTPIYANSPATDLEETDPYDIKLNPSKIITQADLEALMQAFPELFSEPIDFKGGDLFEDNL